MKYTSNRHGSIINIWFGHDIQIEARPPLGKIEQMMAVAAGGKYAKMPVCASLNCSTHSAMQVKCRATMAAKNIRRYTQLY